MRTLCRNLLAPLVLASTTACAVELSQAPLPPGETQSLLPIDDGSSTPGEFASFETATEFAPQEQAASLKKQKEALTKAVAGAYAPVFYNNNFNYLFNPLYNQRYLGEDLKRLSVGDCWMLDLGGQYRLRHHSERGMRGSGLTGVNDDFLLQRTRLFSNLELDDDLRIYAEMIDANSSFERFTPRLIEEDRTDLLNLFVDVKLFETASGNLKMRSGRQELLYGSERLISPLDWANTRRTFEGYKFLWQGDDWNIDAFCTRPVIVNPKAFDSADYKQEFSGVFATYKAIKNNTFDFYYLSYYNGRGANNFQFQTVGGRWFGNDGPQLWELEGGVQYGNNTDQSGHAAGFATAGRGYRWEQHCWKPTLWCYYDWASGGTVTGAGQGVNQLFPLGHKYLGFMDLYGRSNIQSPNVQLSWQPHKKVKALIWYYYMFLANVKDSPYNVNSTAFNGANKPGSGDLGHEIDLTLSYALHPRHDILLGYSHFFSGAYYRTTPGITYTGDANFFYTQYQFNF